MERFAGNTNLNGATISWRAIAAQIPKTPDTGVYCPKTILWEKWLIFGNLKIRIRMRTDLTDFLNQWNDIMMAKLLNLFVVVKCMTVLFGQKVLVHQLLHMLHITGSLLLAI